MPPDAGVADDAARGRSTRRRRPPAEELEEVGLRPRTLDEFVGQAQLTEHLEIVLEAARQRRQPVDHLLFAGPPGLGKTSLAGIVAAEMGVGLRITSGPVLARAGDLAALLTDLQEGDVLFIDEIHRLHRSVEEILYPAMEDFKLDILIGKGPTARSHPTRPAPLHPGRRDHPHRAGVGPVARPLRVRRPARPLRRRTSSQAIVQRSAGILGVPHRRRGRRAASPSGRGARRGSPTGCCAGCATSSRCGARAASPAPRPARASSSSASTSWASTRSTGPSSTRCAAASPAGRSGLTTLAQCVGEEPDTIEDAYEPYLLQRG